MWLMTSIPLSPRGTFYESPHDYGGVFVQGGESGLVVVTNGQNYYTAFVECATDTTFIRGEGATLAEADEECWAKLQAFQGCPGHEFEPRGYRNGAGTCKHCKTFRARVFTAAQLFLFCTQCGTPTFHTAGGTGTGQPLCEQHDPLWPYINAYYEALRLRDKGGQATSMFKRLAAVAHFGGDPDPEALEWAYNNLDMTEAPRMAAEGTNDRD